MRRLRCALLVLAAGAAAPGLLASEDFLLTARQSGGGLDVTYDWTAHLSAGKITIERPGRKAKVWRIQPKDVDALRRALDSAAFAALRDRYGCAECSDNPVCSLRVSSGQQARTVAVHAYFPSADGVDRQEMAEVRRFMSVWRAVKRLARLDGMKDVCP
jgi:hypothetical protein